MNIGFAKRLIRDDRRGSGQSRQVEGLGSRMEHDAMICGIFAQGGVRRMMIAWKHQVAMNLI